MDSTVAVVNRQAAVSGFNPLRMSGTALPPNLLMAAKLLALSYVLTGQLGGLPDGFLPFIPYLGHFNGSEVYRHALQAAIAVAALALWLNRAVRASSLLIGSALLLAIFSSQPYYHNNLLYTGLFFVIAGLYDRRLGSLVFRAQLAVIYLGAGVNKLLLADWRTGAFVQDWLRPPHYPTGHLYGHLAALLPGTMLSATLSWFAILTEFALIPLLLVPRFVPLAVVVGVSYHAGLVLITGGSTFNMFWYALVATYIALLQWPTVLVVGYNPERILQRIAHGVLGRVDAERSVRWRHHDIARLELETGTGEYTGAAAAARILLHTPAFYVACVFLITLVHPYGPAAIPLITYALILCIGYGYVDRVRAIKSRPRGHRPRHRALRRAPSEAHL
jgi:hypothetical protein